MYNVNTYPPEGNSSMPSGNLRRADGGSDGGVRGRGGCRWIEQLAAKGVGCARARRRRSTASRGEPENGSEKDFAATQQTQTN